MADFGAYDITCPSCSRVVGEQPASVLEFLDPKFTCRFCDRKNSLRQRRPAEMGKFVSTYHDYRRALLGGFFKSTGSGLFRANWVRQTEDPQDVQRVYLQNDGTFRAYRADENPVCHGSSLAELQACIGS